MSWYEAVLITLLIIGGWAALPVAVDLIDKAWQRRMTATLWRSLPYDPGPAQQERDRVVAAHAARRVADILSAALDSPEASGASEA